MSDPIPTDFAAQQSTPDSNVDAIAHADEKKGAVVHSFDPSADPASKAAAAGKAKDQLRGISASSGDTGGGQEVVLDTGKGISITPTISVVDTDAAPRADAASPTTLASPRSPVPPEEAIPGAMPEGLAPLIPDWYKVGWRQVGGIDASLSTEQDQVDKAVYTAFIKEQYYGQWFHNAGIIIFAVVASHYVTLFRLGWGALIIILAVCSTYYTTSMARVRRRARDDIQRELVKTRMLSEHETAEWINHFLDRFWLIYEPVLSATIVSSVDQILSTNTPPFLDSIRLSTFTLGTKAPRIDQVRTFPKTAEDVVMMDWGLSFTPTDVSDMTPKQAAVKVNPKIVLSIRVGKGLATAAMPILLEDITFRGLMRIRLKLMTNFPHIQLVDISFIEKPVIDYVLKPIGGETFGFDIANIPGLSSFIRDMTHQTLGPMMYDPNVFTLNLEQLLSGTPLDTAIGVLQVTVHTARGLKGTKMGGGSPDPYVSMSINQRAELARTKYKHNTSNPTWHETKFLLITSLSETLTLNVMDYNDHRKDSDMGVVSYELANLQEEAVRDDLVAPVFRDGKERGELRFDLSFYPVLAPKKGPDGKEEPIPETTVGIVRLTIHQAKDLDHSKSMSGELNPFAKLYLSSSKHAIHSTPRPKHTNNPVWESATEFLCSDRASSVVAVKVVDDRDLLSDPTVGYLSIKLDDLLKAAKQTDRDWWPLSKCKSGRLRMTAEWKPLNMAGSMHSADHYTPPIGLIRLWMKKATDVKNVEAALGGKSDPYMRVLLNNSTMARTEVINNNLNPQWDQIVYVPVHHLKEVLFLECMDYQHLTKDRSLGSVELRLSELARACEDRDYPYESTGRIEREDNIRLDKGIMKGKLHYVAEFVPALFLKDVAFDAPSNEIQRSVEGQDAETASIVSEAGTIPSVEEREEIPPITVSSKDARHEGEMFQPSHKKGARSTDTTRTTDTARTTEEPAQYEGKVLSKEELLTHQSGIIVFNVVGGKLAKRAHLEVLFDEGYWPAMATPRPRSTQARFDQVGEGFIKELDFSQVWLRLNERDEDEKENIVAQVKIDAKEFLHKALDGPTTFTLRDADDKHQSTIEIAAKYVPVNITLEPRESINNQGILRIDLLDGKDIRAADRSGKSDPFAVFTFNDQKIFRSQTKKKTLTPEWNETFEVTIPSRVGSRLEVEVSDWNQIEQAKSLGVGTIDVESLEPFEGTTRTVMLSSPKHGEKGEIRVNLLFQPSIIAKTRKATSTFSTAGRAVTQVGGVPIVAGKGIVHGVGHAGKSVIGVFKRDHGSRVSLDHEAFENGAAEPTSGQVSAPADVSADGSAGLAGASAPSAPMNSNGNAKAPTTYGNLKLTVVAAKDLVGESPGEMVKPYVVVKVGDKEFKTKHAGKTVAPEWDETQRFLTGPDTKSITCAVFDHKTLGKDRLIGEAVVDIWQHIQPQSPATDIWAELRDGQGLLKLRLEFEQGRKGTPSIASMDRSPSRFMSLRKSSLGRNPDAPQ